MMIFHSSFPLLLLLNGRFAASNVYSQKPLLSNGPVQCEAEFVAENSDPEVCRIKMNLNGISRWMTSRTQSELSSMVGYFLVNNSFLTGPNGAVAELPVLPLTRADHTAYNFLLRDYHIRWRATSLGDTQKLRLFQEDEILPLTIGRTAPEQRNSPINGGLQSPTFREV